MKTFEAPLYVRSHDLTRWILARVASWDPAVREVVGDALAAGARRLVLSVCQALTFIRARGEWAWEADQAVVCLRELLRLACMPGGLSPASHRYAQGELLEIGRMIGGWRKRWTLPHPADRTECDDEETGRGRRRPRLPRRELGQRPEEVPVRVPEQEAPRGPEQEPGVPRPVPHRPEPDGRGGGTGEEEGRDRLSGYDR